MIDPEGYCRGIEAYLCRKNEGHLIRIVGPAFEQVTRWAMQGVPLTVAYAGIDRYFERYYRKGPRRRPVRIEFCEADVLDTFDAWRRAVGVSLPVAATETGEGDAEPGGRKRGSLSRHLERAIARLTTLRGGALVGDDLHHILEHVTRQLDALQSPAKRVRGEAREALLAQLVALDRTLMAAVMESIDDSVRTAAAREATEALSPFRDRMAPDAYQRACAAAQEKHVREHYGLPTIAFE
jgi:hypothetical protein